MPVTAQLEQVLARLGVFDVASNRIVVAAHPSLDLELNVGFQTGFGTLDDRVIAEFVLHLAEEDAAGVHVRLRDEAGWLRLACEITQRRKRDASLSLIVPVGEAHHSNALHETAHRVAEELAPGFQRAVDTNMVFGSHEEVARLGRVM